MSLPRVAPGKGLESSVGVLLTWLLSQIDTAHTALIIVPPIAEGHGAAAFEVGFVTLYQAALSLHKKLLKEERQGRFLRPDASERIGAVLDADPVRSVSEYRFLRNTLVHYGVDKRVAPRLFSNLALFGLVEVHTNGRPFAAVAKDIELGLDRVSDGLRDLLPRMIAPRGSL